jgi:methionyl aminopeptidase
MYEKMKEGGEILSKILITLKNELAEGKEYFYFEKLALDLIYSYGAEPAFKGYKAPFANTKYQYALCFSPNEIIAHGYPEKGKYLKEGDIVSLDLGIKYQGVYLDAALTSYVGEIDQKKKRLIEVTKKALERGIKVAVPGNRVGDIGWAIEKTITDAGFKPIKNLCGHDIGEFIHGEWQIFNFGDPGEGYVLPENIFLCLEPMATFNYELAEQIDDYVFVTKDRSPAAHFEVTIVLFDKKNEVLTPAPLFIQN